MCKDKTEMVEVKNEKRKKMVNKKYKLYYNFYEIFM